MVLFAKIRFAVIDTETNWNDEVMSIGVVVADAETKKEIDSVYYIIEPEYRVGGMYSNELQFDKKKTRVINRRQALNEIKEWLNYFQNFRGKKKLNTERLNIKMSFSNSAFIWKSIYSILII